MAEGHDARKGWLRTITPRVIPLDKMIRSFADRTTENLWRGIGSRRLPPENASRGLVKLRLLDAAVSLDDLRVPPGNRLEPLHGNRKGQYSIRINDQWRICFRWKDGARDVEITDYHR